MLKFFSKTFYFFFNFNPILKISNSTHLAVLTVFKDMLQAGQQEDWLCTEQRWCLPVWVRLYLKKKKKKKKRQPNCVPALIDKLDMQRWQLHKWFYTLQLCSKTLGTIHQQNFFFLFFFPFYFSQQKPLSSSGINWKQKKFGDFFVLFVFGTVN